MINEHALTVSEPLSSEDLHYLVLKANRLGKNGRTIARVYSQEDNEGKHIYFEVDAPKEKNG